jgi:hypothetical protein
MRFIPSPTAARQEHVLVKCPKCGAHVSFWRLNPSTLCAECSAAKQREDEGKQRENEARQRDQQQELIKRQSERTCLCCHGSNLVDGSLSGFKFTFVPAGWGLWTGYTPNAFVCLDCGFLGHYLVSTDIQHLRKKLPR